MVTRTDGRSSFQLTRAGLVACNEIYAFCAFAMDQRSLPLIGDFTDCSLFLDGVDLLVSLVYLKSGNGGFTGLSDYYD